MRYSRRIVGAFVAVAVSAAWSWSVVAQPRHRIHRAGSGWALEDLPTGQPRPFDMWITRLANAAFDSRYTDDVVAQLDDYQRYGVNTVVLSLQGGQLGRATYPKVFTPTGMLDLQSPVFANLRRLLAETDRRGMVVIAQVWYFNRVNDVPTDKGALRATRAAVAWFRDTGFRHYVFDLVNEFGIGQASRRRLFGTLPGALSLLDAVRQEDPGVLVGMSPSTRLFWPAGPVPRSNRTVRADFIIGHNQPVSPNNLGAYWFGTYPARPTDWPCLNNEFWFHCPYERVPRRNPRTGQNDYGHFIASETQYYLTDLARLRGFGCFGNVHARRQQHVWISAQLPVAVVGPEGTQPESALAPAEPSLHWLYHAIATMRRFGPLAARHDFNRDYASGFEFLSGEWSAASGVLRQANVQAASADARFVGDAGDFELEFDAAIERAPSGRSALGVQFGFADRRRDGVGLTIEPGRLVLARTGGSAWGRICARTSNGLERYRLTVDGARVRVAVNGAPCFDVNDSSLPVGRNITFTTVRAAARFDNVRFTPVRTVDFEDGRTGDWIARSTAHWRVQALNAQDRAWRATVPANETRRVVLDRKLRTYSVDCELDLSGASSIVFLLDCDDVTAVLPRGYLLTLGAGGALSLASSDGTRVAPIASAQATIANPRAIQLSIASFGGRIIVTLDGSVVLDAIDPNPRPARGGVAIAATPGTTWIDDLVLRVGPNRPPMASVAVRSGPSRLVVDVGDDDGLGDVRWFDVGIDTGQGFVDVTPLLVGAYSPFARVADADGLRLRFTLTGPPAEIMAAFPIRVRVADCAGLRATALHAPSP